jgi:hypothetical protein
METQSPHLTAGQAQPVNFPVVVSGKISNPGERQAPSLQSLEIFAQFSHFG